MQPFSFKGYLIRMKRLRNFQVKRLTQFRRVNVYDEFHTQSRDDDLKVTAQSFNLYPSGGAAVSTGTFGRRAIARVVVHLAVAPYS